MTAYLIVNVTVTGSTSEIAEYRARVGATVEPYGGEYLARSDTPEVWEGAWTADQVVLLRFPDAESARAWNDSDAYRAIAPLRTENAATSRLLVPGLD